MCACVSIPVHVLVRPRGGDFLYSEEEFAVICEDVKMFRAAKVAGIVVGFLRDDGTVDAARVCTVAALAAPLPVTFHRGV